MFIAILILIFSSIPVFAFLKMIHSFQYARIHREPKKTIHLIEFFFFFLVIGMILLGLFLNRFGMEAGVPLTVYSLTGKSEDSYAALSNQHVLVVILLLTLGFIAYWYLRTRLERIPPIMYLICSTLLFMNILFAGLYITHTGFTHYNDSILMGISIVLIQMGYSSLSLLYVAELRTSLHFFIVSQEESVSDYNWFLRWLYRVSRRFRRMPVLWGMLFFPMLIGIQLILILFGQRPDSVIRVFFDTSSFHYSQVPVPDPKVVQGDGHYLCTVTVKGHKKLVKPVRAGIRHGEWIAVNRQLLIANAFEHIIEQYIPNAHRVIRRLYNKYGYPISKHIKSRWSADLIYLLMKPLEWFFLFVLYTVDAKPENRIHVQYSELRK